MQYVASQFKSCWTTHTIPVAGGLWRMHLKPGLTLSRQNTDWRLVHQGPHSRIYRVEGGRMPCIAKLIIPRSQPRDSIRKYGFSQARREATSNRMLAQLGLTTMPPFGWGMTASPLARYESVLFVQPLPRVTSGLTFIRNETDAQLRLEFLCKLAQQIACMLNHGFIHKDAHFDNVYICADITLIWIDNDIRRPRTLAGRREGIGKMLSLLKTTARTDLQPNEWQFMIRTLNSYLDSSLEEQGLANEIS